MAVAIKDEAKIKFERTALKEPEMSSTVWLQFKEITLLENNKHTVEHGEGLVDLHLNFAQRLLKHQFPKVNGLRLTLLQGQSHSQATAILYSCCTSKPITGLLHAQRRRGKLSMYTTLCIHQ